MKGSLWLNLKGAKYPWQKSLDIDNLGAAFKIMGDEKRGCHPSCDCQF